MVYHLENYTRKICLHWQTEKRAVPGQKEAWKESVMKKISVANVNKKGIKPTRYSPSLNFSPLQPGVAFLYPLKTENFQVFWCFQGV